MRRRLFNLGAALSLLLCIAVVFAWSVGSERPRVWGWWGETLAAGIYADSNGLAVKLLVKKPEYRLRAGRLEPPKGFSSLESVGMRSPFSTSEGWERWNFGYASLDFPANCQWWLLVPSWLPLLLSVLVLATWVRTQLRARRRSGYCRACGYDLRATPDRCPECGVPSEPPHNPAMQRTATAESGAIQ